MSAWREDYRGQEPPPDVTRVWRLKDGRRIGVGDDLWFNERWYWWRRDTFLSFWPPRWRRPRFYPWNPWRIYIHRRPDLPPDWRSRVPDGGSP